MKPIKSVVFVPILIGLIGGAFLVLATLAGEARATHNEREEGPCRPDSVQLVAASSSPRQALNGALTADCRPRDTAECSIPNTPRLPRMAYVSNIDALLGTQAFSRTSVMSCITSMGSGQTTEWAILRSCLPQNTPCTTSQRLAPSPTSTAPSFSTVSLGSIENQSLIELAPDVTEQSLLIGTGTPSIAASTAANAQGNGGPVDAEGWRVLRMCESGDDYTVIDGLGLFDGAYQYHPETWPGAAREAGYGQYADRPANEAPPEVQDAVTVYVWFTYDPVSQWPNCYDDVERSQGRPAPCLGHNVVPCGANQIDRSADPETFAEGNPLGGLTFTGMITGLVAA